MHISRYLRPLAIAIALFPLACSSPEREAMKQAANAAVTAFEDTKTAMQSADSTYYLYRDSSQEVLDYEGYVRSAVIYAGAVVDELEARFVAFGSAIIARNAALSVGDFEGIEDMENALDNACDLAFAAHADAETASEAMETKFSGYEAMLSEYPAAGYETYATAAIVSEAAVKSIEQMTAAAQSARVSSDLCIEAKTGDIDVKNFEAYVSALKAMDKTDSDAEAYEDYSDDSFQHAVFSYDRSDEHFTARRKFMRRAVEMGQEAFVDSAYAAFSKENRSFTERASALLRSGGQRTSEELAFLSSEEARVPETRSARGDRAREEIKELLRYEFSLYEANIKIQDAESAEELARAAKAYEMLQNSRPQ